MVEMATSTSVESILDAPGRYEALVPGCSEFVRLALHRREWSNGDGEQLSILDEYGQVIFRFEAAKRALDGLVALADSALHRDPVEKGEVQDKFRYLSVDLRSTVEFAERLCKSLGKRLPEGVTTKWHEQLRAIRNQVVHQGAARIRFQHPGDEGWMVCCQTAGSTEGAMQIEFQVGNTKRWCSSRELESIMLAPVRALLERDVTRTLIERVRGKDSG